MRTLFKSCNLSEQTHDHLNVFAADGTTTTLTFNLVGARLAEALVPTWQTTAQTNLALTLLLHLCFVTLSILLRSRVFQSHVFHPCVLVSSFPVPRFTVPRFQRPPYFCRSALVDNQSAFWSLHMLYGKTFPAFPFSPATATVDTERKNGNGMVETRHDSSVICTVPAQ